MHRQPRIARFRVESLEGRSLMASSLGASMGLLVHHPAEVARPQAQVVAIAVKANAPAAAKYNYRGHKVDLTSVAKEQRPELSTYIRQQIDLVESLPISRAQKVWFRSVPISVKPGLTSPGRYSRSKGLELDDSTSPPDNPVLLHELLHAYQSQKMSAAGKATVEAAYQQALAISAADPDGHYEAGSYMLTNVNEFFAMTGSVMLHGRAARPPAMRSTVQELQPTYANFLVKEFGLKLA